MDSLQTSIRSLTRPLNGQYPRPWMTAMLQPQTARVFVVGYNQATGLQQNSVRDHDEYIDALFNRNGMSCDKLYGKMRPGGSPSLTRTNVLKLRRCLSDVGICDVLETNVICYATPMGSDLNKRQNPGGKERGRKIFKTVLQIIRPPVIVAHGAGTRRELAQLLCGTLPSVPSEAAEVSCARLQTHLDGRPYAPLIFVIPSLAPPAWNLWRTWAKSYLVDTCARVRAFLGAQEILPGSSSADRAGRFGE